MGVGGRFAIELFLGVSIRVHEDTDLILFRDEQLLAQAWLKDWQLYASDPPGTLRPWKAGEVLPPGIHDIWAHHHSAEAWQFQFLVTEVEGSEWVSRRDPSIRGVREDLITQYAGVPCIRPEVQLLYKAKGQRPKDEQDFAACLPRLNAEARLWLKETLRLLYPDGHDWLQRLERT